MRHVVALAALFAVGGPPGPFRPAMAAGPATGRIAGHVVLSRAITSRRMRFRLYPDLGQGSAPAEEPPRSNEMANVVIYVDSSGPEPRPPEPSRPLVMEQRDEAFGPHVLPVARGTSVEFLNSDPFYHNVFSLSGVKTFDLGRFPRGRFKTVTFDRAGVVRIFCHIHADMSATVLVLDTPFYTSPDSTGSFALDGIPPGTYRIVAWHERAKPIVERVVVAAGETVDLSFNIPVDVRAVGR